MLDPVILHGVMMSWFQTRHYGFIAGDDGIEYFAHETRFKTGVGLPRGTKVSFSLTEFKGRQIANDIAVREGSDVR